MPLSPTPSGDVTIVGTVPLSTSLAFDPHLSGVASGIVAPTLTVESTITSTSQPPSSASPAPTTSDTSGPSTSIPVITGITLGIFACLALALIVFMSIRNKKRTTRSRAMSRDGKSWSHMKDDPAAQPVQMQMRARSHAQNASFSALNPSPRDQEFPSLNSTHALIARHQAAGEHTAAHAHHPFTQPASPSQNPFFTPAQPARTPTTPEYTDDSHIPNPFASPSHSPSSSQTCSISSYYALPQVHTLRAQQHTRDSIISPSTSDSPYDFAAPTEQPAPARRPSETAPRLHERRAMQDLISALDDEHNRARTHRKPPPSSFTPKSLVVDTSHGASRLSLGEGLVTPGGHSIHDGHVGTVYAENGDADWSTSGTAHARENVLLPPALNIEGDRRMPNKHEGNVAP